jgi:hypothetical protein
MRNSGLRKRADPVRLGISKMKDKPSSLHRVCRVLCKRGGCTRERVSRSGSNRRFVAKGTTNAFVVRSRSIVRQRSRDLPSFIDKPQSTPGKMRGARRQNLGEVTRGAAAASRKWKRIRFPRRVLLWHFNTPGRYVHTLPKVLEGIGGLTGGASTQCCVIPKPPEKVFE